MSSETLKKNALDMIRLLKENGIAGKGEGQWRAGFKADPTTMNFEDKGEVDNFTGVFFVQVNNGEDDNFFEPPSELGLEHDDSHGKLKGYWKTFVPQEIKAVRTLVETGISAPKSSSELRSWDSRKISKYLLGEADSYEALYACLISQLENVSTPEAQNAIEQLTALMETTTVPVSKKVLHVKDPEDELVRKMEALSVSPKRRSPSPKRHSPKGSPKADEKMNKLIDKYKKKLSAKEDTATIADAIKRLAKELNLNSDYMEETYDFYGFGQSRLKPFRRMSKRNKKFKMTTRRTSRFKRKIRRSGRSLKKNRRRTSKGKTNTKMRKNFGSSIYGLQGGLQNGPIYSGVYPMTLKVNETLPNLNNVKRTYALNEFGKPKRRKSPRKSPRRSKSNFGCGLYGCGRSFGSCGCGDSKPEEEEE